ncbi:MAG: hypothetical protein JWQ28_106 [Pedobacter sp.]|nr:hypothetical protein [Pedobacter sp.]
MKTLSILIFLTVVLFATGVNAQKSPGKGAESVPLRLRVSDNKRFLVYEDGKPFFYLGDTAWELFHRLSLEEAALYMDDRKSKGFTVIQACVLAELDGLHAPNVYKHTPLQNDDPATPNEAYFQDIDKFLKLAASKGLYVGLLPTWGDKVFRNNWGNGPEIFNAKNAGVYGKFLGTRYKDQRNIIWILGGDRNPRDSNDVAIWRAMAEGIVEGVGGYGRAVMTFHPAPKADGGSSTWFQNDRWLDFNMLQTGHCKNGNNYEKISHDYNLTPIKPVLDGEPLYEDHPVCFDLKKNGYSNANDVRKLAYWQLFAGAFGHTYGCHAVWQFYDKGREPVNSPARTWKEALDLPGARQMGYVKKLILSKPVLDRIPDQGLIVGDNPKDSSYCSATRAANGSYAFIYTPTGKVLRIKTSTLKGRSLTMQWYNPRTGMYSKKENQVKKPEMLFVPTESAQGLDWVLVLSAAFG